MAESKSTLFLVLLLAALVSCAESQRICREIADIAFVVDSSGSINDRDSRNWDRVKEFLKSIVDRLNIGRDDTRVALVKFANRGHLEFNLAEHFSAREVKRGIDRMRYLDSNTNTSGGLYVMLRQVFNGSDASGDRRQVPDRAIIITDGESTRDKQYTKRYANEAKRKGIKIVAVGVTDQVNMDELRDIASPPDGDMSNVYEVEDFDKLSEILDGLLTQTCYEMTTTPRPFTTTELPRSPECEENADFVVVLDSSGSVGATNFNRAKTWIKDLILDLDVENDVINVGMMVFSNSPELVFHLDRFTSRQDMLEAVDDVRYLRGTTNTAGALRYARETMFTRANGDRQDAKNVLLLVTNGDSNDREQTISEAKMTKDGGIHILVTVVENWFQMEEMNAIASYPYNSNRFHLTSYERMDEDFKDTMQELVCNRVDECRSNPCRNAMSCVDEVGFFSCQCERGYGGVTCSERCEEPADIVFALDASGSIGRQSFEKMVDFVRSVVQGLRMGSEGSSSVSRVGLLTFSDDVHQEFNLNDYDKKYDVLNAFPPYYRGGSTNTAAAIRFMREEMFTRDNGDQSNVQNIGIIITDGRSDDESQTWQEAMMARNEGIHLISLGVGRSIRMRELEAIASFPNQVNDNVLIANDFDELEDLRESLVDAICNNEDECDNRPCQNGGTCEDLINGYECRCSNRYTGRICDRECSGEADVVFVVDASGSIRRERFKVVLDFVRDIIMDMEVGPDKTQVGVVSWSGDAKVDFALDTYSTKQDILQALQYVEYRAGRTNTASALAMMRTQIFDERGDRDDVPNFAYIITDGNSNINQQNTIKEAIAAKISAIHIITVSIGTDLNRIELRGIASDIAENNMFSVESFVDLSDLTELMPRQICNDENECSSRPCGNGGTCVDGLQRYVCICPDGRTGINCQFSCTRQLDVAFLLDLSGSTEKEYRRIVQFTKRVINDLDMNFRRTQIGVVTFGDEANLEFSMDTYSDKLEILTAIAFVPDKGRTNTQAAIRMARNDVFTSSRRDRRGVPNVAILVTDGYSNVQKDNTIPEADRAKRDGIAMYVVAVGDSIDMGEVNAIAGTSGTSPEDYIFRIRDDDDIDDVADELAETLCQ